jgi:hypothetical protein
VDAHGSSELVGPGWVWTSGRRHHRVWRRGRHRVESCAGRRSSEPHVAGGVRPRRARACWGNGRWAVRLAFTRAATYKHPSLCTWSTSGPPRPPHDCRTLQHTHTHRYNGASVRRPPSPPLPPPFPPSPRTTDAMAYLRPSGRREHHEADGASKVLPVNARIGTGRVIGVSDDSAPAWTHSSSTDVGNV